MQQPIQRLLVANRGEIACRIMRTAKYMGIGTVAVHSDVDRHAAHVAAADVAVNLGGARPDESYLVIDSIIQAAKDTGANAIHPGYGFLAENADFAKAIDAAGLIFVGPPVGAIEAMGSKSASKALMEDAGVPLVPGYHGEDQELEHFINAANDIGYPVLLKASAGGGGRGMKVVESEAELAEAFASARRESKAAFGDDRMLVEKYILEPRHVEIQIFADQHGNCIYLHERDCSIQRRHQKVVEEAPAPGLTPELRQAMGEAAVRAAQAVDYVGAGTVEFLLDARGHFYFMEMNTRLQVEHPITELITGTDLVAWQLQVARGEALPLRQEDIPMHGHAMEVRVYAEDPDNDFLPATGILEVYQEPADGPGRRVDTGVRQGDEVSPFYDPMIAKVIAWGADREEARLRLLDMLAETTIAGVRTNLEFLQRILAHDAFAEGKVQTGFIEDYHDDLFPTKAPLDEQFWQLAGAAWLHSHPQPERAEDTNSPWASLAAGWRSGAPQRAYLQLELNEEVHTVWVNADTLASTHWQDDQLHYLADGVQQHTIAITDNNALYLHWQGEVHTLRLADPIAAAKADAQQGGLTAPMNGNIVNVAVTPGQTVAVGDLLVVVEAMKMEHSIRAHEDGTVAAVFCAEGDMVAEGTILVELEAE